MKDLSSDWIVAISVPDSIVSDRGSKSSRRISGQPLPLSLKSTPASLPLSIPKSTVKPNVRIRHLKRTFGSLLTRIKTTCLNFFPLPNSPTTLRSINRLGCLRSTLITGSIPASSPNLPLSKFPPPTSLHPIYVRFTIALSKTSNTPKTSKPVITTPSTSQLKFPPAIWSGSMPQISRQLAPPRSSIGSASVPSKSSNVSVYKLTKSNCPSRCATSTTSSTYPSWNPTVPPHGFPPPLPPLYTKDNQGYFEIEANLNSKSFGRTTKYLIKWKGYPDSDNSWEPLSNIPARALVKEFLPISCIYLWL